jgi:hypothetical protein
MGIQSVTTPPDGDDRIHAMVIKAAATLTRIPKSPEALAEILIEEIALSTECTNADFDGVYAVLQTRAAILASCRAIVSWAAFSYARAWRERCAA